MRKALFGLATAVVGCALFVGNGFADRDDPGANQISVQTEIQRGLLAVDSIPETLDAENLANRCNKILAQNDQQNTVTDAFSLGLLVRKMMRFEKIAGDPLASQASRLTASAQAKLAQSTARTICFGILKLDENFELERVFNSDEVGRLKEP
jgi:hypothetical protein